MPGNWKSEYVCYVEHFVSNTGIAPATPAGRLSVFQFPRYRPNDPSSSLPRDSLIDLSSQRRVSALPLLQERAAHLTVEPNPNGFVVVGLDIANTHGSDFP